MLTELSTVTPLTVTGNVTVLSPAVNTMFVKPLLFGCSCVPLLAMVAMAGSSDLYCTFVASSLPSLSTAT